MAVDQSLVDMLRPTEVAGKKPGKHFVAFTHEEWIEVNKAFGGLSSPTAYKELIMKIARGQITLSVPKPK